MCGIFGALTFTDPFRSPDYDRFVELTNLVQYRGPNAAGHFACRTNERRAVPDKESFDVFFGHRRLSIIDLSESANEPFTDDGETWLLFNGEIFNYVELRDDLIHKGHNFITESDTEVILKVYREHGEDSFQLLNGMWAFAILDARRRRVVLSRDRFSIKPLYLLEQDNRIFFSSELKQLTPLLGAKRLNQAVMSTYMNQGLIDYNNETFYQGIRKLPPKSNLVVELDTGRTRETKYWDYPEKGTSSTSFSDVVEGFRTLFTDSLRIRLRSDVKIGALVSGGLDSSAIAVVAEQLQPGFQTYSAVSDNARFSEEKYIDILCREKRLVNKKCQFQFGEAIGMLDKVAWHNDEPLGGFSVVAHYQLMHQIRQETDVTVVLSGQGGDEILLGYLKFYFFALRQYARNGRLVKAGSEFLFSLLNGTCVKQFEWARAQRYMPWSHRNGRQNTFLRLDVDPEPVWKVATLEQRQMLDIDKYSVPSLCHYEDRNSMAHSLEIRLPFLDHRLVEFMLSVPVDMKIHHGWTKYVMREALPALPEAIRWRKDKQWFMTPEHQWLKNDLVDRIERNFQGQSMLQKMGIVDDKLFLDQYRAFRHGDTSIPHQQIGRAFFAEIWAQSNFA